jgi:hypothetical protein
MGSGVNSWWCYLRWWLDGVQGVMVRWLKLYGELWPDNFVVLLDGVRVGLSSRVRFGLTTLPIQQDRSSST